MNLEQFKNRKRFKGCIIVNDDPISANSFRYVLKNKRTTPKGIYKQRRKAIINSRFDRSIALRLQMYPNVKPIIIGSRGIIVNGSFKTCAE